MPTTTNNGWPTPADTDLVKNGADAIRDLGNAIDTTLGVYSPATPGLVKINTTSFSAVSAQSFNQFSTTYSHYYVTYSIVGSTSVAIEFRLTDTSGNPISSAGYYGYTTNYASTSITQAANSSSTTLMGYLTSQNDHDGNFVFFNPYSTTLKSRLIFDSSGSVALRQFGAGAQLSAARNNGFELKPNTGTITGVASIYGFNV
jgi:hypothetical protein